MLTVLARNLLRDQTKNKIVIEPEFPENKPANWCTWIHKDKVSILKIQ